MNVKFIVTGKQAHQLTKTFFEKINLPVINILMSYNIKAQIIVINCH